MTSGAGAMTKKVLTTPIQDSDLEALNIGDIFYLTGMLVTGRDEVHSRLIKENMELSVNLSGMALYHAGPIVKEKEGAKGKYEIVSAGPTTSNRMEKYEKEFIEKTGVKVIVGKGGMGPNTTEACKENKAIHAVFPGGCGVLGVSQIEEVERVEWLELGMSEAVWVLRVKEFGPLIVSIDTKGNNLFENNKADIDIKKEEALKEFSRRY